MEDVLGDGVDVGGRCDYTHSLKKIKKNWGETNTL